MFVRFTKGASRVVELARGEARDLGFPDVGTEHLLLALLRADKNLLEPTDMDIDRVRGEIERIAFPVADRRVEDPLPWAPGAKLAFELAAREARNLEHLEVAEGHLFLALLAITDGFAARALVNLGLTLGDLREATLRKLNAEP